MRFLPRFLALLMLVTAAAAQTPPIRIMPLGDSITQGSVPGGYRNKIYQTLTAAGYNVDLVGTQTINGVATLPDSDHEGHSGWIIGQLDANIAGWFNSIANPDVILLHIGTNDFGTGTDTPNAINRLDALITKMATLRPYAHIIVTNLMVRGEPQNTSIQAQFNPFVQARVNAQAALGRRVTFLDMRSFVPLAEMPDQLHPNQAGYDHMADAWLPAIQSVIAPLGDSLPPGIAGAVATDATHAVVTFSKPVQDAAAALGIFSINGLAISAATLDAATKRSVTLTTSAMAAGSYTVTVSGVRDRTAAANLIPPASTAAFLGPAVRGAVNNVPEAAAYALVYSLNIPASADYNITPPAYDVDYHGSVGGFTRVAYYLELQAPNQPLQFCWVSMNAFTADAGKIGVPHLNANAVFQQTVTAMNVFSNVAGVTTGTGLGGNLEFWSTNYAQANSANVPGASSSAYDFGDQPSAGSYGSMQIHNPGAVQTLIAFNHWGNAVGAAPDLGIGNNPGGEPDWTFAGNAGGYTIRTLQAYVLLGNDTTAPTIASVTPAASLDKVLVTFSEWLGAGAANVANFNIAGLTITAATLRANGRDIELTTAAQTPGANYTLAVANVADRSGNVIAPGSSVNFTALNPPDITGNVPEAAGYTLVQTLALPGANPNWSTQPASYVIDQRALIAKPFDRIGYYLELDTKWVWVSANAFTTNIDRVGVPTLASGAVFQMPLVNMNVAAAAGSGIVTGTGLAGGNIEFWPYNYAPENAAGVANASASLFDWGDTLNTGGYYGSMQIHNSAASQVIFAFNNWGNGGGTCDLGIGNHATGQPDWTFAGNATGYTNRKLYVYVRTYDVAPAIVSPPAPRSAAAGTATTFTVTASGTDPLAYQWRRNTVPITGATSVSFTLPNVQAGHAGGYDVVVTNPGGSATSPSAALTVTGLTEDPLSLRLTAQGGGVLLSYTGSPLSPFTVQRSSDLAQWANIANISANAAGVIIFTDPSPPADHAFYRLVRITP